MAEFNPDEYLGGFDPDEYLTAPQEISPVESGLRGAAQGFSLGYGDEIAGAFGAALDKIAGSRSGRGGNKPFIDLFREKRDKERLRNEAASKENPWSYGVSQFGGAIGPAILTGGSAAALVGTGAVAGFGGSNADLTKGELVPAAIDTAVGGGLGYAGALIPKGFSKVGKKISDKLGAGAENMAVRATGATGKQLEQFKPGTGRTLLDEGVVRFGSSPAGIASRAEDALKSAGEQIDSALSKTPGTINKQVIVDKINARIAELEADPSQAGIVKKLKAIQESIAEPKVADSMPATVAERIKRNFQRQSNYAKPNTTVANKEAASIYQQEVERAANEAGPEIGKEFQEGKKLYGMMKPVQELAEKRANQLQQHPIGGLNDIMTIGAGGVVKGPVGAVAAPILRRGIAPRLASSAAKTLDVASDFAGSASEIFDRAVAPVARAAAITTSEQSPGTAIVDAVAGTKYHKMLSDAAQRGPDAVKTMDFVLQQTDPEYQELKKAK